MTFKIEKAQSGEVTILRLIGRLESESLDELKHQIETSKSIIVLDLAEVDLVAVEVVRFLSRCQCEGAAITNASSFIREWMLRERRRIKGLRGQRPNED